MELLIASCLCSHHDHLTSIKLSSGDLTDSGKTNFIRGQYLDISFFAIFDLCADIDSDSKKVYVSNAASNTVSVINTATHQVVATITVENSPTGIAYDSDSKEMYVDNHGDNIVSVIDPYNGHVLNTIDVGSNPVVVAYDSDSKEIYVTNQGSNTISVIIKDKHPSNTTIINTRQDNGDHVLNNSVIDSGSIDFTVQEIAGFYPLASFQCSLETFNGNSGPFERCGQLTSYDQGNISYNNLVLGQGYLFKIRAVDSHGNVDPVPVGFNWFIAREGSPSPNNSTTSVKGLESLSSFINNTSNHLSKTALQSLEDPINASIILLNHQQQPSSSSSTTAVCYTMDGFLQAVSRNESTGQLTHQQDIEIK